MLDPELPETYTSSGCMRSEKEVGKEVGGWPEGGSSENGGSSEKQNLRKGGGNMAATEWDVFSAKEKNVEEWPRLH